MISIYNLIYNLKRTVALVYNQIQFWNKNMTTSTSSSSTKTIDDINKCKDKFNMEFLQSRNESSNNPFFISNRYEQTITLINKVKLKYYAHRTKKEISLLKTHPLTLTPAIPNIHRFSRVLKFSRKEKVFTNSIFQCR